MAEPEEKLLAEYFQTITAEAEMVPEAKLDAAVHSGMQRGRSRGLFQRSRYAVAVLVAMVAAMVVAIFFIVPWAYERVQPEHAQQPPKSWGELEVFRPVIGNEITLESALDAGLVRTVGSSSEEQKGYKVTVDGVLADSKGMIVLYTFQNNSGKRAELGGFSLRNPQSDELSYASFSGWSQDEGGPGLTRKYIHFIWEDE